MKHCYSVFSSLVKKIMNSQLNFVYGPSGKNHYVVTFVPVAQKCLLSCVEYDVLNIHEDIAMECDTSGFWMG